VAQEAQQAPIPTNLLTPSPGVFCTTMNTCQMLGSMRRRVIPQLSRGVSQVLSEPMAWNQAPTVVTQLANGVKVASKQTFGEVTSVGVYLDAGCRSETTENAGASHLLKQLAFTGTAKRSRSQLEEEVESMGATLDMASGREQTSFEMTVGKSDVAHGIDILADLVKNPAVSNLEKEKESILRSLEETDLPTKAVIQDRLHTCAFRDCSLGFSLVGPFEGVESLTQAHLQSYVDANYTAENMVVATAGPLPHEELVKMAESAFGTVPKGPALEYGTKPYFCGAELIYRNDEMGPLAYVAVGFEGVPWRSPDAVGLMVAQQVIGSYKKNEGLVPGTISGNRTVNAVANKMSVGCAEEFETFNMFYKDTGMFGFYIVCDEVAVEHAIGELMFGVNLLSHTITDEEVERAKRELIASFLGGDGTTASTCAQVGQQVLRYGRGVPPAEMMLRINAVDAEDIKRVAWKYFADQEIAVTGLGPLHGMPQYYDLRRSTNMHRY